MGRRSDRSGDGTPRRCRGENPKLRTLTLNKFNIPKIANPRVSAVTKLEMVHQADAGMGFQLSLLQYTLSIRNRNPRGDCEGINKSIQDQKMFQEPSRIYGLHFNKECRASRTGSKD